MWPKSFPTEKLRGGFASRLRVLLMAFSTGYKKDTKGMGPRWGCSLGSSWAYWHMAHNR